MLAQFPMYDCPYSGVPIFVFHFSLLTTFIHDVIERLFFFYLCLVYFGFAKLSPEASVPSCNDKKIFVFFIVFIAFCEFWAFIFNIFCVTIIRFLFYPDISGGYHCGSGQFIYQAFTSVAEIFRIMK